MERLSEPRVRRPLDPVGHRECQFVAILSRTEIRYFVRDRRATKGAREARVKRLGEMHMRRVAVEHPRDLGRPNQGAKSKKPASAGSCGQSFNCDEKLQLSGATCQSRFEVPRSASAVRRVSPENRSVCCGIPPLEVGRARSPLYLGLCPNPSILCCTESDYLVRTMRGPWRSTVQRPRERLLHPLATLAPTRELVL